MSISEQYTEYKEILIKMDHPWTAETLGVDGRTYRYHGDGKINIAVVLDRDDQFMLLIKHAKCEPA